MTADVVLLQRALAAKKIPVGSIDGKLGPQTMRGLLRYLVAAPLGSNLLELGVDLAHAFPEYEVSTRLRVVHFLAQAAEETDDFRTFEEYGGREYCQRYEGRNDLGNIYIGDGYKFRGRGIFQLTGRRNYRKYGAALGIDLENQPDLAAQPPTAVKIACLFWREHGLNELADQDNIAAITKRINGGENGLSNRRYYLDRLKTIWPGET